MFDRFLIWLRGPEPNALLVAEVETLRAERDAMAARNKKQASPVRFIGEEFGGEFDYEQTDCGRNR